MYKRTHKTLNCIPIRISNQVCTSITRLLKFTQITLTVFVIQYRVKMAAIEFEIELLVIETKVVENPKENRGIGAK